MATVTPLGLVSAFFVCSGLIIALLLAFNLMRHKQSMKIMNPVWILTGLWGHFIALYAYFSFGKDKEKTMGKEKDMDMDMDMDMKMDMNMNMDMDMGGNRPKWQSVALSALHCGAGCTLADIIGEGFSIIFPMSLFGNWTLDFVLALAIGIYFQYSAIREMETISPSNAFVKAFKADFLSLTSWQIGMYGWMALVYFVFFKNDTLDKGTWTFWFMMQIAMWFGFIVAYPMNALLIKTGIKKGM